MASRSLAVFSDAAEDLQRRMKWENACDALNIIISMTVVFHDRVMRKYGSTHAAGDSTEARDYKDTLSRMMWGLDGLFAQPDGAAILVKLPATVYDDARNSPTYMRMLDGWRAKGWVTTVPAAEFRALARQTFNVTTNVARPAGMTSTPEVNALGLAFLVVFVVAVICVTIIAALHSEPAEAWAERVRADAKTSTARAAIVQACLDGKMDCKDAAAMLNELPPPPDTHLFGSIGIGSLVKWGALIAGVVLLGPPLISAVMAMLAARTAGKAARAAA